MASPAQVYCREIGLDDLASVASLLTKGFARYRGSTYWVHAIWRLSHHPTPEGFPKYGYLLEYNGSPVGVLLLIFTRVLIDGEVGIRCNVSSWYVEPAFRVYGTMLASYGARHRHVTYFNVTPSPNTWPILEAQGFTRFANGYFVSAPALSSAACRSRVAAVTADTVPGDDLQSPELELLRVHTSYGCMSLTCESGGRRYPFVFGLRMKYGIAPLAYLIYCRSLDDFVRFAQPLGRFMILRRFPMVAIDANGRIPGLVGKYFDGWPKYVKGPMQPRLGDVAYSERVMFGF